MVEMMVETVIRMKVVNEAVDELWGKMADMQAGLAAEHQGMAVGVSKAGPTPWAIGEQ